MKETKRLTIRHKETGQILRVRWKDAQQAIKSGHWTHSSKGAWRRTVKNNVDEKLKIERHHRIFKEAA